MFQLQLQVISRSVYLPNGSAIKESNLNSSRDSIKENAILADEYFRATNATFFSEPQIKTPVSKVLRSPGLAGAILEVLTGTALLMNFPGPAMKAALVNSGAEFINLPLSESKINKNLKEFSLGGMQIVGGLWGFKGFVSEVLGTEGDADYSNVSITKKIALSATSILNMFFMLAGAVEKSLLSMVASNRDDKDSVGSNSEYMNASIDAYANRRCSIECIVQAGMPWFLNIKFFKRVFDFWLPYQAIREGLDPFIEYAKRAKNTLLLKVLKVIENPTTLFKKHANDVDRQYTICFPFDKCLKFLLGHEDNEGASGIRNILIKPFYEFFGVKSPDYYLDKNGNIVATWKQEEKAQPQIKNDEKEKINNGSETKDEKAKVVEGSKTLGTKTATA